MTPELLAKLTSLSETIIADKSKEKLEKQLLIKEKKAKLYGGSGIKVFHQDNGKLSVFAPTGMRSEKLLNILDTCTEKIQDFKNNKQETVLSL